jgi:hypothetical protein
VRFQVLTAVSMMFRIVFWDVLPCKIIVDRHFRGVYCLHHQGWSSQHGSTSQKTILNIPSHVSHVLVIPKLLFSRQLQNCWGAIVMCHAIDATDEHKELGTAAKYSTSILVFLYYLFRYFLLSFNISVIPVYPQTTWYKLINHWRSMDHCGNLCSKTQRIRYI